MSIYVDSQLYEDYELQTHKQGCKVSELMLNVMDYYDDKNFSSKNTLKDINFSKTVALKTEATDFLLDDEYRYNHIKLNSEKKFK